MTAWVNGFLGIALVFVIGIFRLGLGELDLALCIAASNAAGLTSLLLYSAANLNPWTRRHLVRGPLRTWVLFLTSYFGLMVALAPALRDGRQFAWLVIPVILTTGFCIQAYGPIQDWLVSRRHRKLGA